MRIKLTRVKHYFITVDRTAVDERTSKNQRHFGIPKFRRIAKLLNRKWRIPQCHRYRWTLTDVQTGSDVSVRSRVQSKLRGPQTGNDVVLRCAVTSR